MIRAGTLAALVLAALAAPAFAQTPRWYAGISGGQSQTGDEFVTNRESTIVNAVSVESDFDSRDHAWKVFGGFRFNDVVAVELAYADLGRHRLTTRTVSIDLVPGAIEIGRKISGYGADVVLTAPLAAPFAVFGRAGAFRSRLEADATLLGGIEFTNTPGDRTRSVTRNETVLHIGAGAEWWFRRNAALRLEWERYHSIGKAFAIGGSGTTGEADTDVVSLGVLMRF
jgi:OmpA-OmpF porin, OOP family